MSRFSIDINEVSDKRELIPAGDYPVRIIKGSTKAGDFKTKAGEERHYINLNFTAVVRDEEVSRIIGQDEPKCFPSVFVSFDSEWKMLKENEALGKFRNAMGFSDSSAFEDGTEDAETMEEYAKKFFLNMAEASVGADLLAKIGTRTYNDELQNTVVSLAAYTE
jgi:hypothetical protein